MKKKILLSILVVVILAIIAAVMLIKQHYENSQEGLTKKYYSEVQDVLALDQKRTVICMKKYDFNGDQVEDYIGITGVEKYHSDDKEILKEFASTLELYQDVEIVYVDGQSKEIKKYISDMSFYPEVKLELKQDEKNRYIFVSDENSGNVLLVILKDNELQNIVKNSIQSDFNGYTINVEFDSENTSKIKVKLDNYARSYLQAMTEEKLLEFEDKNINKDNYRATYLANKFCSFKLEDVDADNILDLVGVQNILYLNDNNKKLSKTAGVVETVFKINDNKIEYNKVEVKI